MIVTPTLETHDVLSRAEANLAEARRLGFERLQLAYEWARLHERARHPGLSASDFTVLGTEGREVYEYAAAELGLALELHPLAAMRLMADAVDLADRLPYVWAALDAGRLEDWVGRRIARATRELCHDQVIRVDAALADVLGSLPPCRLLDVVEARVVEVDQARADRLAERARRERLVKLGRDNEHGVRGVAIRAEAADSLRFYKTIDHLAHLLAEQRVGPGDEAAESMDELRARAVGILGNPLTALRLLVGTDEHDIPERVAEAVLTLGPAKVRNRSVLYLHIDPDTLDGRGVSRAEELGTLTRDQLVRLLGHEHVTLRPVRKLDQDRTIAYLANGPPGQTCVDNLAKLTRRHHRVKTHAGWAVAQQVGGVYVLDHTPRTGPRHRRAGHPPGDGSDQYGVRRWTEGRPAVDDRSLISATLAT